MLVFGISALLIAKNNQNQIIHNYLIGQILRSILKHVCLWAKAELVYHHGERWKLSNSIELLQLTGRLSESSPNVRWLTLFKSNLLSCLLGMGGAFTHMLESRLLLAQGYKDHEHMRFPGVFCDLLSSSWFRFFTFLNTGPLPWHVVKEGRISETASWCRTEALNKLTPRCFHKYGGLFPNEQLHMELGVADLFSFI